MAADALQDNSSRSDIDQVNRQVDGFINIQRFAEHEIRVLFHNTGGSLGLAFHDGNVECA
jgi:hypothetical protein